MVCWLEEKKMGYVRPSSPIIMVMFISMLIVTPTMLSMGDMTLGPPGRADDGTEGMDVVDIETGVVDEEGIGGMDEVGGRHTSEQIG